MMEKNSVYPKMSEKKVERLFSITTRSYLDGGYTQRVSWFLPSIKLHQNSGELETGVRFNRNSCASRVFVCFEHPRCAKVEMEEVAPWIIVNKQIFFSFSVLKQSKSAYFCIHSYLIIKDTLGAHVKLRHSQDTGRVCVYVCNSGRRSRPTFQLSNNYYY
jgi:hypothetical protein